MPGENDLATLYPEIAALWHPTRNGSKTPNTVRTGSNKPYWWKCEKGHEWKRTVCKSIECGPVCPFCSGVRVNPGVNDFRTLYPQLADQWHPTKNGSLKPEDVLPLSNRKAWWIDELGHEWSCEIQQRVSTLSGCPYCANKKALKGFNDLATVCPEVAAQWHSSLNGALKPEMVTRGCSRRVWWQCSEGHVWKAIVYSRTKKNGAGCPVCAGKTRNYNSYSFVDEKLLSPKIKPLNEKELELVAGGMREHYVNGV